MAVLEKPLSKQELNIDSLLENLSDESKRIVLIRLVREAIAKTSGRCLIPFQTEDGEQLGYYVPQAIADDHSRQMDEFFTPERLTRLRNAVATPDSTFDPEELNRTLEEEDRG